MTATGQRVDVCKIVLGVVASLLVIWVFIAMLWGGDAIGDDAEAGGRVTTVVTTTANRLFDVGMRPWWLVQGMPESPLRTALEACHDKPIRRNAWTIGHRGACLMFPEHTEESYRAANEMGAGTIECDVTFTKDRELVCRHAECDLHTTTNILATELAAKCERPFRAANSTHTADAYCCTSALTLAEFKSLKGKMDGYSASATTVSAYMAGTPDYRTDLYASRATLMSHTESIALFTSMGVKMTPELKEGNMPADFSRAQFIEKTVGEYKAAGVAGSDVYMQSFLLSDVLYLIANHTDFAPTAVFLTDPVSTGFPSDAAAYMKDLADSGVKFIAPAVNGLVAVADGELVRTDYAIEAKAAGLKIISWSWERSDYYHNTVSSILDTPSKLMFFLDFLAQEVGLFALFSDWPATVTYYANCMLDTAM